MPKIGATLFEKLSRLSQNPRAVFAAGLAALLAVQARFLSGAWTAWDLRLWDGSWYWGWGRDIAQSFQFPSFENAPLYCAYYAVFHLLFDDPFTIFFMHRLIALLLISVLLYFLFAKLFSPFVAWILSTYFLLLIGEDGVADYAVRFFVIIPLLVGFLFALKKSAYSNGLVLGAFAAAALVRPEYGIVFPLVLAAVFLSDFLKSKGAFPKGRERAIFISTIVLGIAVSVFLVGKLSDTSGRSWLAFGQHYGLGVKARNPQIELDPWLDWPKFTERSFEQSDSVTKAMVHNPEAFFEHVLWNVKSMNKALDHSFKPSYAIASPVMGLIFKRINFLYVSLGLILVLILVFRYRRPQTCPPFVGQAKLYIAVLLSLIPVLFTCLVIHPSPNYLFPVKVVAMIPTGLALQLLIDRFIQQRNQHLLFAVLFTAVILLFPTPFSPPQRPRIVAPAVAALSKFDGGEKYGLIADSAISFCNYSAPDRCNPIEILWIKAPADIEGFLKETNTRVLLIGVRLMSQLNPEWRLYVENLVRNPEEHGWRLIEMTPGFLIYGRKS